jgi:hypothetical protein
MNTKEKEQMDAMLAEIETLKSQKAAADAAIAEALAAAEAAKAEAERAKKAAEPKAKKLTRMDMLVKAIDDGARTKKDIFAAATVLALAQGDKDYTDGWNFNFGYVLNALLGTQLATYDKKTETLTFIGKVVPMDAEIVVKTVETKVA